MRPAHFYIDEKLGVAVSILQRGDGPLRERLVRAWLDALIRLDAHMPVDGEIAERWRELRAMVELVPPEAAGDEGTIAASLRALSDAELRLMVDQIAALHLWAEVDSHGGNASAPSPMNWVYSRAN